jgi:hypothetical protein
MGRHSGKLVYSVSLGTPQALVIAMLPMEIGASSTAKA